MAYDYRPVDRDQGFLIPPDIRDWLDNDHVAWLVLDAVEVMDTSAFHRRRPGRRSESSAAGKRGYDPDLLLGLLIYAYAVGERSSRRIEKLCWTDVAFRVLCGNDIPDHTVISRFRQRHDRAFEDLFTEVLTLCRDQGMGRFGELAVDGTKIAANASKEATRSEKTLREMARDCMDEAYEADRGDEAAVKRGRDDSMPPSLRSRERRKKTIAEALVHLEEAKAADAEKEGKGGIKKAEQLAADKQRKYEQALDKHRDTERRWQERVESGVVRPGSKPLPVSENVTVQKAAGVAERAKQRFEAMGVPASEGGKGRNFRANLTDPESGLMKTRGGFVQGYNAQLVVSSDYLIVCADLSADPADVHAYQPMVTAATTTIEQVWGEGAGIGTVLADAGYCSIDNLGAPGPQRLIATDSRRRRAREDGADPADDAATGVVSQRVSPLMTAMRETLSTEDGQRRYKRRGALVEPVNAHLKDRRGLRRFSRRGLSAARGELFLASAVTNMVRMFTHAPATT